MTYAQMCITYYLHNIPETIIVFFPDFRELEYNFQTQVHLRTLADPYAP